VIGIHEKRKTEENYEKSGKIVAPDRALYLQFVFSVSFKQMLKLVLIKFDLRSIYYVHHSHCRSELEVGLKS
jgi:hypothetical protein